MAPKRTNRLFKKAHFVNRLETSSEILRCSLPTPKLTQKELAKIVPADHTYISKMEKGLFQPTRKLALGLADALGICDPEKRNKFLLAASVLSEEDLNGFQLVKVGNNALGQAFTQGTTAQQLPSAAGAVWPGVQQILTQLQTLTAAVAQLQASVATLQQPYTTINTPSDASEVNIRKTLRQAEMRFSRIIMNWTKKDKKRRDLDEAKEYEEEWTRKVEEEGSLFIVMTGFQGMTIPEGYYDDLVKPILQRKGEEEEKIAEFMRHAILCLERRRKAFDRHVRNPANLFRHITPLRALDMYKYTGFHRPDEWARIYRGTPAKWEQQVRHMRHIIDLLDTYPNYQLGFLTDEARLSDLYKNFVWEIKGGHILKDTFTPHSVFLGSVPQLL